MLRVGWTWVLSGAHIFLFTASSKAQGMVLQPAARSHVRNLCIHYKNCTLI